MVFVSKYPFRLIIKYLSELCNFAIAKLVLCVYLFQENTTLQKRGEKVTVFFGEGRVKVAVGEYTVRVCVHA
jgi:hypothetical protein